MATNISNANGVWTDRSTERMTFKDVEHLSGVSQSKINHALKKRELVPYSTTPLTFLRQDVMAWIEEMSLINEQSVVEGLTKQQRDCFLENGYLHIPGVLCPSELNELQIASDILLQQARSGIADSRFIYKKWSNDLDSVLERVHDVYNMAPAFQRLLSHDLLHYVAKSIMGQPSLVYNTSLVVKIPGYGVPIPVHRDPTWTTRSTRDPVFTVAFYLDTSDDTNGGVYFLPGTHRTRQGRASDLPAENENWWRHGICVRTSPGDVIIHNLGVIHGSKPNYSLALRRTLYYSIISIKEAQSSGRWNEEWINRRLKLMNESH